MGVENDLAQLLQLASQMETPTSGASDPYSLALAEFPATTGTLKEPLVGGREVASYLESDTGKLQYPNGVIVDLVNSAVIPGPWMADPEIEGSSAWLRKIQDEWSAKDFNTWRKRLIDMGYDSLVSGGIASKGGMAADVLEGLRQFHTQRYLNYGKPLRIAPKSSDKEALRKSFDIEAIKARVAERFGAVGIDADDDMVSFFAEDELQLATELARKHPEWTMEQVASGADLRAQKKFVKKPAVKQELKAMEEDEMDDTLLNDMSSIMELGSI